MIEQSWFSNKQILAVGTLEIFLGFSTTTLGVNEMDKTGIEIYKSGILVTSELHAGGILFYSLYKSFLKFGSGNSFERWNEIVDEGFPLDDEVENLLNQKFSGTYSINSKGYIEFECSNLKYICKRMPENILVVSISSQEGYSTGLAFVREENII